MAVIGKIRSNGTLLLLVIGGAMVAFILGDIFSNRAGGQGDRVVGEIGGEKIDVQVFEQRVSKLADSYQLEFQRPVDGAQMDNIRSQIWNQMIREKVVLSQASAAGIQLHKEEYDDVRFGNNMLDDFKNDQNLRNPQTGQVDKGKLIDQLNAIQEAAPMYYEIQKKNVIESRIYSKYMNLIKGSLYVTSAEARQDVNARGAQANFDFVLKGYNSVPDSNYTPTENEIEQYYDRHMDDAEYAQKSSRAFEYVKFPIIPTAEDRDDARAYLADMVQELKETENDSSYIAGASDTRSYFPVAFQEGRLDVVTDSLIANAAVGDVIGPYLQGETYQLAKIVALEDYEEATVRHILLKTNNGKEDDDVVEARADSIERAVKRNRGLFEDMVTKYSEDPGSVADGGVYDWFDRTRMVPEFTEASFDEAKRTISTCKTSYGYHIVEVLDQRTTLQRQIATLTRNIEPSGTTNRNIFKIANDVSLNYASADSFRVASERNGGSWAEVNELFPSVNNVPGLAESSGIVSEVFRMEEVGSLSEPKLAGDNYIVARLIRIREKGAPELDDIRDVIVPEVVKEKKAAAFVKMMTGKNDINALATELGEGVKSANAVNVASVTITGGYAESKVIGQLFQIADGETSAPLIGDQGVYVIRMTSKTGAQDQSDYTIEKANLLTPLVSRAENSVYSALREAAGVTDNRKKFY